ncbi:MAG: deoxynucleoside kinase [Deltaproteobacteria bacterium]|nr:deoxynucleoside kinase [Deltaproteobacteria bacterium]
MGPMRCIAVAGNIGAGKSTLVEFLTKHFEIKPLYEPNDENPYLKDFYADMPRWAFHSQLFFLIRKFKLHKEMEASSGTVLIDRTIYEDAEVFATNLWKMGKMPEREYRSYVSLYETLVEVLRPPDLLIYLRCGRAAVKKRIAIRGRPEEQAIPDEYLDRLARLYERWFTHYQRSPTLVLRTDRIDYVSDLVDQVDVLQTIEKTIGKR